MMNNTFFDAQDYELLHMINMVLDGVSTGKGGHQLIDPAFHPHGIKELALPYDQRIAYSVINLLESLEIGLMEDRLTALEALHDEVLYGTMTTFRYNTGRVLIQIMKRLVRARGDEQLQLALAHDFRTAISGRRRIIRKFLERYHLLEMPEDQAHLAFDHHVHDANTKGRKSPTHLIMDAWIKGIRTLGVVYYNYVPLASAQELLRAARIMDVRVKICVEMKARFHERFVSISWQTVDFADPEEMVAFFQEEETAKLMDMGRESSRYYARYVDMILDNFNAMHRPRLEKLFGVAMAPISQELFKAFVGIGQPSIQHLSELIYQKSLPILTARYEELQNELPGTQGERRTEITTLLERISRFDSNEIKEYWLGLRQNPELTDPYTPRNTGDEPEILQYSIPKLTHLVNRIHSTSQMILNITDLSSADVLELLYDCEGRITHLELFNIKNHSMETTDNLKAINRLQLAINRGNSLGLKRFILNLLHQEERHVGKTSDRYAKLTEILHNIHRLQHFYKVNKLRSTIGSDSLGRFNRKYGMGFACIDTLPRRAQKAVKNSKGERPIIPLRSENDVVVTYTPKESARKAGRFKRWLRNLPGFNYYMYERSYDVRLHSERMRFTAQGNICALGGTHVESMDAPWSRNVQKQPIGPSHEYLNTTMLNLIKVGVGFLLAMLTFMYTQSWWVLMFFGAPLWFAITGLRNIAQAVLGSGGIRRSPLLRWNNFVSWSRLCDSLLYTGISVPLLELVTRVWILQNGFNITPETNQWVFYAVMSAVNGAYIVSHNIYRGFPASAVVGNIFRSALAIPVAVVYNQILAFVLGLGSGQPDLILLYVASINSKLASDTVAGVIEGLADRGVNMQARYLDYKTKMDQLFNSFTRLELMVPQEDSVLQALATPGGLGSNPKDGVREMERQLIMDSLDLMYFWMYLPRSRQTLSLMLKTMGQAERNIFCKAQYVLNQKEDVQELFRSGALGHDFKRALTFYAQHFTTYLREITKVSRVS